MNNNTNNIILIILLLLIKLTLILKISNDNKYY